MENINELSDTELLLLCKRWREAQAIASKNADKYSKELKRRKRERRHAQIQNINSEVQAEGLQIA
jgi:hypothetical protein